MDIDNSFQSNLLQSRFDLQKVLIVDYKTRTDRPQHVYFNLPLKDMLSSAIYVLWEGENMTYIGQSVHWYWRVLSHIRNAKSNKKNTTHFNILPTEKSQLNQVEKRLINHFKPTYNIQHK